MGHEKRRICFRKGFAKASALGIVHFPAFCMLLSRLKQPPDCEDRCLNVTSMIYAIGDIQYLSVMAQGLGKTIACVPAEA